MFNVVVSKVVARAFSRFSPLGAGALLLFASFLPRIVQSQRSPRPKPSPAPTAPAAPVAPFRPGETLSYSGEWLKMSDVVTALITVEGEGPFMGRPSWHFKTQFHTRNPLHYVAPVDDQFDSYSAQSDLAGYQFEMYTHQSGKSETRILRLSSTQSPAPRDATQVQVLPGTRDPLGFAFYLRTINWEKTTEVHSPVYDGHKLYDVQAIMATPSEEVAVPAGKFAATGISIHVFDHGAELSDFKITLWLAKDAPRTPVLLEVETPLSTGRIGLIQASSAH